MQYRICFKKASKTSKIKKFFEDCKNKIKNSWIKMREFIGIQSNKIKAFNERIQYGNIFSRIGIFILFLIPLFITGVLCLYSLIWFVVTIATFFDHNWTELLKYMPLTFGSVLFNIVIAICAFSSFYSVIESALDNLNGDLSSVKQYLICCIPSIVICAIIFGIMFYKPAYDWVCTALVWLFWIKVAIGLISMASGNEPDYDVVQIFIPRK